MNDITALMATMKAAAEKAIADEGLTWWSEEQLASDYGLSLHPADAKFIALASHENVLALVEALEKAQQSVELVDLQRDKIKRLESDLWDKEQLRKVHSEKSFELEGKVRELEARNQKDFVWRGKEISRLNDEVDELKEKLESRTVTVKLPILKQTESGERYVWSDGVFNYRSDVIGILRAAGIQVIEGEV